MDRTFQPRDRVNQDIGVLDTISFLKSGLVLALSKECRLFVIIPIIINLLVLGLGGYAIHTLVSSFIASYLDDLPEWLSFLSWIVSFILFLTIGFVGCYIFSTVATIIASPFYGLLAQKVEQVLTNDPHAGSDPNEGIVDVLKDIPRILKRELQKLAFYLPRLLLCLVISFIPVVNVISPILWFLLAAWMMSIQYVDYAYDNHKIPFANMRRELAFYRLPTFGLGAIISLGMTVPLLNIVLPPAAVCAGTKYYLEIQNRYSLDRDMETNKAR